MQHGTQDKGQQIRHITNPKTHAVALGSESVLVQISLWQCGQIIFICTSSHCFIIGWWKFISREWRIHYLPGSTNFWVRSLFRHVFLVSFIEQGLTGKAVDATLGSAHITVNKNSVPNDPQSPFVTSGIRIGTPAATTRGFGESECRDITNWICDICDDIENPDVVNEVRAKVEELCSRFPVYK
jgi:hypothetical protein